MAGEFHLYLIELDPALCERRNCVCKRGPVYVGSTIRTREERFEQHMSGYKAARVVNRYGVSLMKFPNGVKSYDRAFFSRDEVERSEARLAKRLGKLGYCVHGGH